MHFLDESGFAPTLPTGYTWTRIGERKVIPYEAPEGRRVNVVGALAPYSSDGPNLVYETRRRDQGKYDAAAHLRFICDKVAGLPAEVPAGYRIERPCVIVLDNYSVHHAGAVKSEIPKLEAMGVYFHYLPPYSPELNDIEPLWRQVKYQDLPERSHKTAASLQDAVEQALNTRSRELRESMKYLSRSA